MVDLSQYIELFVSEAAEHIGKMEAALASLDRDSDDSAAVDLFFRHGHTLKGMAGAMGFEQTYALVHSLETFMTPYRKGAERYSYEASLVVRVGMKTLREIVEHVKKKGSEGNVPKEVIKNLEERILTKGEAKDSSMPSFAAADVRLSGERLEEISKNVHDILHKHSVLNEILYRMENSEIDTLLSGMGTSINALYRYVLELRLMPLDLVLAPLPPLVKRTSEAMGKSVNLTIKNPNIQVDRSIIEGLGRALIHIVRNSIDHGIESPDERKNSGKNREGNISIICARDNDIVSIEISDDGRGIDRKKVVEKARAGGFLSDDASDASKIPWLQIVELLCAPGLSTSEKVTGVSGRGVGLDVVKETVISLGGRFSIASEWGKGASFFIQLPVSMSRQKVLIVKSGDFNVGIPMFDIDSIRRGTIEKLMGGALSVLFPNAAFSVHGWSLYSLLTLEDIPNPYLMENKTYDFLILTTRWGKRALWVENILGGQELIMRQVLPPLDKVREINMTSILADGTPLLVIDINNLVERYEVQLSL